MISAAAVFLFGLSGLFVSSSQKTVRAAPALTPELKRAKTVRGLE